MQHPTRWEEIDGHNPEVTMIHSYAVAGHARTATDEGGERS